MHKVVQTYLPPDLRLDPHLLLEVIFLTNSLRIIKYWGTLLFGTRTIADIFAGACLFAQQGSACAGLTGRGRCQPARLRVWAKCCGTFLTFMSGLVCLRFCY